MIGLSKIWPEYFQYIYFPLELEKTHLSRLVHVSSKSVTDYAGMKCRVNQNPGYETHHYPCVAQSTGTGTGSAGPGGGWGRNYAC